jgi:hypothetical protein
LSSVVVTYAIVGSMPVARSRMPRSSGNVFTAELSGSISTVEAAIAERAC